MPKKATRDTKPIHHDFNSPKPFRRISVTNNHKDSRYINTAQTSLSVYLGGGKNSFFLVLRLVDLSERAIAQLADDVPNVFRLHVSDDQVLGARLSTTLREKQNHD